MRGHLRKRGSTWELRAYAGIDPLTNRQRYLTRTFRGGKREAEEALARFVTEVSGGGHAAQDTTVGDLIRDWLALVNRELSPTTARGYDWIVKTYVTPTLGTVPLARLRTAQLDRFYGQLREKGGQDGKPLSAATVRQVHAIIRRALQQDVRWGWIAANPAALAPPPKVRATQLTPREPGDVVRLIETARTSGAHSHFADVEMEAFSAVTVFRGPRRTIVHNDSHSPGRQASNLTHELGHALLLHPPSAALDDRGCRLWDQNIEDEAQWLAGALLLTEDAALHIARNGITVQAAADHFGIS